MISNVKNTRNKYLKCKKEIADDHNMNSNYFINNNQYKKNNNMIYIINNHNSNENYNYNTTTSNNESNNNNNNNSTNNQESTNSKMTKFQTSNNNYYDYEIIKFRIQKTEFTLNDGKLLKNLIPLLLNSLNMKKIKYDEKNNIFILPQTLSKITFEYFLFLMDYLYSNQNQINNLNEPLQIKAIKKLKIEELKKIIDISFDLNSFIIINYVMINIIYHQINKDNCVQIIKHFSGYLKLINEYEYDFLFFTNIIQHCYNCCSNNLIYLINQIEEELLNFDNKIIEDIINIYFKNYHKNCNNNNQDDNDKIFQLLIKNRNIKNDIFILLENERKNSLEIFSNELYIFKELSNRKADITWKIKCDDISQGIFKQHIFMFENLNINVICYYDNNNDTLNLAIQILTKKDNNCNNNNKNRKKKSDKDNLNNSFNNDNSIIFTGNKFDNNYNMNSLDNKEIETINNNSNNTLNINNNNKNNDNDLDIISLLNLVEIKEINYRTKINFNYINPSSNLKILILQKKNFFQFYSNYYNKTNNSNSLNNSLDITFQIYLKRNYIFPYIINEISDNFNKYYNKNSIKLLPYLVFNLILKNKRLNNQNEDNLLNSILLWVNAKDYSRIRNSKELLKLVKWEKISTNKLIDFLMYKSSIFKNFPDLYNYFFNEFQKRIQDDFCNCYTQSNISLNTNNKNDTNENSNNNNNSDTTLNIMLKKIIENSNLLNIKLENYEKNSSICSKNNNRNNSFICTSNNSSEVRNKKNIKNYESDSNSTKNCLTKTDDYCSKTLNENLIIFQKGLSSNPSAKKMNINSSHRKNFFSNDIENMLANKEELGKNIKMKKGITQKFNTNSNSLHDLKKNAMSPEFSISFDNNVELFSKLYKENNNTNNFLNNKANKTQNNTQNNSISNAKSICTNYNNYITYSTNNTNNNTNISYNINDKLINKSKYLNIAKTENSSIKGHSKNKFNNSIYKNYLNSVCLNNNNTLKKGKGLINNTQQTFYNNNNSNKGISLNTSYKNGSIINTASSNISKDKLAKTTNQFYKTLNNSEKKIINMKINSHKFK